MVADNDPSVLELLVVDLGVEGHDVVATAMTGEDAVARCLEHRPDVLIVDQRMPPGISGLETARQVLERLPRTRILLYTNYRDPELYRGACDLGITFLPKGNLRALRRAVVDDRLVRFRPPGGAVS